MCNDSISDMCPRLPVRTGRYYESARARGAFGERPLRVFANSPRTTAPLLRKSRVIAPATVITAGWQWYQANGSRGWQERKPTGPQLACLRNDQMQIDHSRVHRAFAAMSPGFPRMSILFAEQQDRQTIKLIPLTHRESEYRCNWNFGNRRAGIMFFVPFLFFFSVWYCLVSGRRFCKGLYYATV